MSELPRQTAVKPVDIQAILKEIRGFDHPKHKERIKVSAYVLEYRRGNQRLVFFGAKHTYDPKSPMIADLQQKLADFLDVTSKEKTVLMIEGMHGGFDRDKILEGINTLEEGVPRFGEKALPLLVSREKDLVIESPEAPEEVIIQEMIDRGFEHEDIALYLVLRGFTSVIGRGMRMSEGCESKDDWLIQCAPKSNF